MCVRRALARAGSGKSTTVLALMGLIPIINGRVEVDGVNVRRLPLDVLRGTVAAMLQDAILSVPREPPQQPGRLGLTKQ
jgi:ABC-type multidrug transport system fused ATPase/permease subunit